MSSSWVSLLPDTSQAQPSPARNRVHLHLYNCSCDNIKSYFEPPVSPLPSAAASSPSSASTPSPDRLAAYRLQASITVSTMVDFVNGEVEEDEIVDSEDEDEENQSGNRTRKTRVAIANSWSRLAAEHPDIKIGGAVANLEFDDRNKAASDTVRATVIALLIAAINHIALLNHLVKFWSTIFKDKKAVRRLAETLYKGLAPGVVTLFALGRGQFFDIALLIKLLRPARFLRHWGVYLKLGIPKPGSGLPLFVYVGLATGQMGLIGRFMSHIQARIRGQ